MSYSDLIQNEGERAEFLMVLKPARQVTSWTSFAANVYSNSFTYGYVSRVTIDGVEQTLIADSGLSSGEYYWDSTNEVVYIYSTNPANDYIVVVYELYVSTYGANFPRIPTSAVSATNIDVYYNPIIIKTPEFKATLSNSLLGFLPSQTTTSVLNNAEHFFEKHLYDSSFNQKDVDIYHWLGALETANVKLISSGLMTNVKYADINVVIGILDRIDIFDKEYRNVNNSFYNTTDFPNIVPYAIGKPIRFVYGRADEVMLVNLDYNVVAPTTSNNRIWAVREGAQSQKTQTVSAAPASTGTRTYLNDTEGLDVGDSVRINKAADEYKLITAVSRTGNEYIEHTALGGASAAAADTVNRSTAGNVYIIQGGVEYPAMYIRDYTESVSNNVIVITFTAGAEASMGINTLAGTEEVYARIYGKENDVTLGGAPFGSDSSIYGTLTNPAVILFDLLKKAGLAEADMNNASFTTLSGNIGSEEVGFALPRTSFNNFQRYKDLCVVLMQSNLIKLFLNADNEWEVAIIADLTAEDFTIQEDEILEGSIRYVLNYKDIISESIVSYNFREYSDNSDKSSTDSDVAKYLHEVSKQRTFQTYLLNSSDAATLSEKYSFIFGDRLGDITFSTKNRFFTATINDTIKIELEKLLGFEYDEGTLRDRLFSVVSLNKGLRQVGITCSDQKGVSDNSGSF